jgi:hypothetical protein
MRMENSRPVELHSEILSPKQTLKDKVSNSESKKQEYTGRNLGDRLGTLIVHMTCLVHLISGFPLRSNIYKYLNNSRAMQNWKMSHLANNQGD